MTAQVEGRKKLRVLTVWTSDVVQQLPGVQNPDGADCTRCFKTNTDLAGETIAE